MASHAETKIDCSKVYVKQSTFSNEETGMFDGAFAAVAIKEGELVEKGLMRRLPEGFDGNTCPYIFTWSTERPNKVREKEELTLFCVYRWYGRVGRVGMAIFLAKRMGKGKVIGLRFELSYCIGMEFIYDSYLPNKWEK